MLRFKQFISEAKLSASGINAERHVTEYITNNESKRLTTAKPFAHIGQGVSVNIHGPARKHPVTGKWMATVSTDEEPDKKVETEVSKLNKPEGKRTHSKKKEEQQIQSLSDQIEHHKGENKTIPIRINGVIHHVSSVGTPPGDPKADFHLNDENGNPIYYASLKDGTHPKHYQQLGGISKKTPSVANHPFVKKHIEQVREKFPNGVPAGGGTYVSPTLDQNNPEHRRLIHAATFGHDHGGDHGLYNVHSVIQGNMRLVPRQHPEHGTVYDLEAAHILHNENHPDQTLPFESRIASMYRHGRKTDGIPNTRTMILPVEGRKSAEEVAVRKLSKKREKK